MKNLIKVPFLYYWQNLGSMRRFHYFRRTVHEKGNVTSTAPRLPLASSTRETNKLEFGWTLWKASILRSIQMYDPQLWKRARLSLRYPHI